MHELFAVWFEKKGLKLIAANALVYALLLIPFNQLQWVVAGIPVRPAAAIPVVCGILFGPAAAWGLGIGNIAGDLFGSWSPMSIVGFFINMAYPYFAYRLWYKLVMKREAGFDQYNDVRVLVCDDCSDIIEHVSPRCCRHHLL